MRELLLMAHIGGATVLIGTGAGIAFFMLMAHRTGDPAVIAPVARIVVIADYLFTATAVALQPITGAWLALRAGWSLTEPWILLSLLLYAGVGAFWLPVVWMQSRMRRLAEAAHAAGAPLPPEYRRLFGWWFAFGFPGFGGVVAILWLMVAKPVLW